MASFEVRQIFIPYCLKRLEGGGYLVLNRKYKPLGTFSEDHVDYETHPSRFKFKRALSAKQIAWLSHDGSTNPECIYLYDDGCIPTANQASWVAYSERLQRLAAYDIQS